MPKVSVITPCFNAERYIAETISSVRGQTFTDWEHIVVDDGSTDGSATVVEALLPEDSRLKLRRQPNGYTGVARNNGFAACSPDSRYLLFLDADDLLEPDALDIMTRYLDVHAGVGLAYCCLTKVDSDNRPYPAQQQYPPDVPRYVPSCLRIRKLPVEQPETPFISMMAYYHAIPSCCLFRRTTFEAAGKWDEAYSRRRIISEDKDIVLSCALQAPVHLIPQYLLRYRVHGDNLTGKGWIDGQKYLEQKWARGEGLTASQKHLARKALTFDRYLAAYLMFRGAREQLLQGHYVSGARCCVQGLRKSARCVASVFQSGVVLKSPELLP